MEAGTQWGNNAAASDVVIERTKDLNTERAVYQVEDPVDNGVTERLENHTVEKNVSQVAISKNRNSKQTLPPRHSLPRESKTAHKVIKEPSRDLGKKIPPHRN